MIISKKLLWVGALALACVSLAGFGGLHHSGLELFSHFRLQYALCSLPALLIALWQGHRPSSTIVLGCLILNGALVLSATGWPPTVGALIAEEARAERHGSGLRLLHANVLMSNRQYERFAGLVRKANPDIWFVQEVDQEWLTFLRREFAGDYPFSVAEPNNSRSGIAAFSRIPLGGARVLRTGPKINGGGPSLELRLHPPAAQSIRLYSSHPPPPITAANARTRNLQIRELLAIADSEAGPYVLIGDLNNSPYSPWFADWVERSRLLPPAPAGIVYTWPAWFPGPGIEIDHCLSSTGARVASRRRGPAIGSDHYPLLCEIHIVNNSQK